MDPLFIYFESKKNTSDPPFDDYIQVCFSELEAGKPFPFINLQVERISSCLHEAAMTGYFKPSLE